MNEYQRTDAEAIAAIANHINTHLDSVFKNNAVMITKLAIAVYENTAIVPAESDAAAAQAEQPNFKRA